MVALAASRGHYGVVKDFGCVKWDFCTVTVTRHRLNQDGTYAVEGSSSPVHPVHQCSSNRLSGRNFATALLGEAGFLALATGRPGWRSRGTAKTGGGSETRPLLVLGCVWRVWVRWRRRWSGFSGTRGCWRSWTGGPGLARWRCRRCRRACRSCAGAGPPGGGFPRGR